MKTKDGRDIYQTLTMV